MNHKRILYMAVPIFMSVFHSCEKETVSSDAPAATASLTTLEELKTFTVETNKGRLSEKESIPTGKTDLYYDEYVENNFKEKVVVSVRFNGSADATVSGLPAGDTVNVQGGLVEVRSHIKGLTLMVSGETSNGSLKILSERKFCLKLCNAAITNPYGSAINIQDGNCFVVLQGTNVLSDGADAEYSHPKGQDEKAVLFSNDDLRFSGDGELVITANNSKGKSCLSSDDAIFIRPNTNICLTAGKNAGHGIKSKENIVIKGGALNIETAGDGQKGMFSNGNMLVDGGRATIITKGDVDSLDLTSPVGSAAIKCDGVLNVKGGELWLKSTGQGGKGVSAGGGINFSGGDMYIITQGDLYGVSDSQSGPGGPSHDGPREGKDSLGSSVRPPRPDSINVHRRPESEKSDSTVSVSAKGMRCSGDIVISGGNICIRTSGSNAEGIESKTSLTFKGGYTSVLAFDDGLNAQTINISGGHVFAMSSDKCDGIDSNGSIHATGGVLIGIGGSRKTNDGIDLQDTLTVENATIIGLANSGLAEGFIDGHYIKTGFSGAEGDCLSLCDGDKPLATFFLPKDYATGTLLLSTPTMNSGSYSLKTAVAPLDGVIWMNCLQNASKVEGGNSQSVTAQ